jgi:hypothetical protein
VSHAVTEENPASNRVLCPKCKLSITFASISIGSVEQCPHCKKWFAVSLDTIQPDLSAGGDGGYDLQIKIPNQSPGYELLSDAYPQRLPQTEPESDIDIEEEKPAWRPMKVPPLWLFFRGTFSYPFRGGIQNYIVLTALLLILQVLIASAIYFSTFSSTSRASIPMWFYSVILFGFSTVILMVLLFTMSAHALNTLQDASEGCDRPVTTSWGWFLYWFEETGYILISFFWGALPVSILVALAPGFESIKFPLVVLFEVILFPLCLLSMLEKDSLLTPFSKPVWRTLVTAWHVWALFYLYTLLIGETYLYFWRVNPYRSLWSDIAIQTVLLPFLWIVYFRLLGRLAWFCSGGFELRHPIRT